MKLLIAFLISMEALAGAGTFPQGDSVKMLKDKLKFKTGRTIESTTVDPTSVATSGDQGSVLINDTGIYFKSDNGTTTNWIKSEEELPIGNKGDLLTNNGSQDIAFAVGTDGKILSADSTKTSGLSWINPDGRDNNAINFVTDASFEKEALTPDTNPSTLTSFQTYTTDDELYSEFNLKYFRSPWAGLSAADLYLRDTFNRSDMSGKQGLFSIWINNDAADLKLCLRVDDATFTNACDPAYELTLKSDGTWHKYEIPFLFGNASVQYEIYNESFTGNANILVDNVYIGTMPDGYIQEVGQAQFVGDIYFPSTNCQWILNTGTTFQSFPVDSDCSYVTRGNVLQPSTNIPAIKIPNARTDGYYKIKFNGLIGITSSGVSDTCNFNLSDTGAQTNYGGYAYTATVSTASGSDARFTNEITGNFKFSSTGDKTIEILARPNSSGDSCTVAAQSTNFGGTISAHFYPDASNTIVAQNTGIEVPIVEEWQSFTPTGTFTNTTYTGHYRRVGDSMELRIRGVLFGTPAATSSLQVNLPAGFSIDSTKMNSPTFLDSSFGNAVLSNDGNVFYNSQASSNGNNIYLTHENSTSGQVGSVTNTVPFAWGAGDRFTITFKVPIQGWSSTETKDVKVIGKFEQIEEVTADLTAATANEFVASVSSLEVVSGENFDWLNTCTKNVSSPYQVTCTFNAGIFSATPVCNLTGVDSFNDSMPDSIRISSVNSNQVVIAKTFNNSVTTGLPFNIKCTKAGADYNKSFVGAVINASQSAQEIADIVRTDIVTSNLVKVRARMNDSLSVPTSTRTDVVYKNELQDNFNAYNPVTGIFTSPKETCYAIKAGLIYTAITEDRIIDMSICRGSTCVGASDEARVADRKRSAGANPQGSVSTVNFCMAKNEQMIIGTFHNDGATATTLNLAHLFNELSITELPDTTSIILNSDEAQQIADVVRTDIVSSDLVKVVARGNAGGNIPIGSAFDFTEVSDPQGNWNGTTFTSLKPGTVTYYIEGNMAGDAGQTLHSIIAQRSVGGIIYLKLGQADGRYPHFSGFIELQQNETVFFKSTVAFNLTNEPTIHYLTITEVPTTESIVKNLLAEASQTKCQTKFLSANVTADGTSDNSSGSYIATLDSIEFNNLVVGKKYEVKAYLRSGNAASGDNIVLRLTNNGVKVASPVTGAQVGLAPSAFDIGIFTAQSTSLFAESLSISAGNIISGVPNDTEYTHVTLCQLSDTVVETAEW